MACQPKMRLVLAFLLSSMVITASSCTDCDGGNVTCVDGVCLRRCVNLTSSGECLHCRDFRFYGKQCENNCSHTCLNSRCQLNNSRVVCTEGCVAGKKGDNCEVDCPTSCTKCERYGDGCVGPCKSPQYYGDYCDKSCPSGCRDGCDRNTGECDSCVSGYRGRYCNVTCPMNSYCKHGCDMDTGECYNCTPGYRGRYCNVTCSSYCRDGCDRDTGKCDSCTMGYTGRYCKETCPTNCQDECDGNKGICEDCLNNCPEDCYRDTGECDSCTTGYRGRYCNDNIYCRDGCDRDTGECDDCSQNCSDVEIRAQGSVVVTVLICLAVTICLAFIGILVWYRKTRKTKLKYNMILTPLGERNEHIEPNCNNTGHEWELDNTLYETAENVQSVARVKPCTELKGEKSELHMKQEFKALPKPEVQSSHYGRLEENFHKNRYKDILPFDSTRVCMDVKDEGDSGYINASFIDGYRQETQYIAAQGPTKTLIVDFWRMIWQVEVTTIVMLTNLVEDGNVKCEMYWPSCGTDYSTYGDVSVQCVEEKVFEHYTVRSLAVWETNGQTRTLQQLHFTFWPAQGVPEEVTSLIDFYKVVKNTKTDGDGPTLVHCSAGVGRTGTFLALVYLIEQARYESRACVYSCVHDIRFQRMKMVHTEEQYIFLYRVLMGALETRGILPDESVPVWLQCRLCWETDRHHPVVNGIFLVNNEQIRNQSNSDASLQKAVPV